MSLVLDDYNALNKINYIITKVFYTLLTNKSSYVICTQATLAFTPVLIFCDHILKILTVFKVPYRLHAVLVHEGQANAGHYWAYIYDPQHCCWMKYNDIAVTKSSWEELVRDSFGGYRNASAYCLMYINEKKPFLVQGNLIMYKSPCS